MGWCDQVRSKRMAFILCRLTLAPTTNWEIKMKQLAKRSQRISGAGAILALERAQALEAQGVDMIHLEVGELDFDTPEHIVEAGVAALRNGRTRYGATAGTLILREAIADYVSRSRETAVSTADSTSALSTSVSPAHVICTPGVKGALYFAMMALIEAGDEVIIPNPGFTAYTAIIQFAGGKPISLPLRAVNGFLPDIDELRSLITERTKMIILNSPGNPTGAVFPLKTLEAIAEIALEHDLWIISDEIYAQLSFTGAMAPSIYTLPDMAGRTILMDGFSKAYAMTGWRLGFGIFPEPMIAPVLAMMVNDHSCLPLFIQDAGVAALRGSQSCVATIRDELKLRRDLVVPALNQLPSITCPMPEGAFYAMMDISALDMNAAEFADRMLDVGVSLLPGGVFGQYGEQYVRLAYTVSRDRLAEALERIQRVRIWETRNLGGSSTLDR